MRTALTLVCAALVVLAAGCQDDARQPKLADPPPAQRPVPEWEADDGVLLRAGLRDGYDGTSMSLSADGTVVRVADDSVLGGADDYTSWTLDEQGVAAVLAHFDEVGTRTAEPGDFGDDQVGRGLRTVSVSWADGRGIGGGAETDDPATLDRFEQLWDVVEGLSEPSTYASHVVRQPAPWLPSEVGLFMGPEDPANPFPVVDWPLTATIAELGSPTESPTGDQGWLGVCLRDGDARTLLTSLGDRAWGVYRWADGSGRRWTGRIDVTTPGYRLLDGPCAEVDIPGITD